jgi:hypothetical protein
MTFDEMFRKGEWVQILGCPGRFVLHGVSPAFSVSDLFGHEVPVQCFDSIAATDSVLVVKLDVGGTISYHRADGTFLHTLNTEDGFLRKLEQLGIKL